MLDPAPIQHRSVGAEAEYQRLGDQANSPFNIMTTNISAEPLGISTSQRTLNLFSSKRQKPVSSFVRRSNRRHSRKAYSEALPWGLSRRAASGSSRRFLAEGNTKGALSAHQANIEGTAINSSISPSYQHSVYRSQQYPSILIPNPPYSSSPRSVQSELIIPTHCQSPSAVPVLQQLRDTLPRHPVAALVRVELPPLPFSRLDCVRRWKSALERKDDITHGSSMWEYGIGYAVRKSLPKGLLKSRSRGEGNQR